jgi:hypothetical protein
VTPVGAAGDLVASLGSCFGSEKGGVESGTVRKQCQYQELPVERMVVAPGVSCTSSSAQSGGFPFILRYTPCRRRKASHSTGRRR